MVHSRTFSNRSKLSITPLPLSRAANLLVLLIKNPWADAAGWRQVTVQAGSVAHHDNPPGCVPVCEFGRQRAWTNASGRQHPARWLAPRSTRRPTAARQPPVGHDLDSPDAAAVVAAVHSLVSAPALRPVLAQVQKPSLWRVPGKAPYQYDPTAGRISCQGNVGVRPEDIGSFFAHVPSGHMGRDSWRQPNENGPDTANAHTHVKG